MMTPFHAWVAIHYRWQPEHPAVTSRAITFNEFLGPYTQLGYWISVTGMSKQIN